MSEQRNIIIDNIDFSEALRYLDVYKRQGFNNAGGIKYLHNNYADSLLSVGTDFGKNMGNVQI